MSRLLWSILFLLVLPLPGRANFGLLRRPVPVSASFYAPVPMYYAAPVVTGPLVLPSMVCPSVVPLPSEGMIMPSTGPTLAVPPPIAGQPIMPTVPGTRAVPLMPLAPPQSAPPSENPGLPRVQETSLKPRNTDYDLYTTAGGSTGSAATFWNLTGSALQVTIEGEVRTLATGQSLAVPVSREFRWTIAGRETVTSRLPAEGTGVTVMIRR